MTRILMVCGQSALGVPDVALQGRTDLRFRGHAVWYGESGFSSLSESR